MKTSVMLLLACLVSATLFAQSTKDSLYRTNPVWIHMMEDEQCNYFEAMKAFELFWQQKELPIVEHDLFSAEANEQANLLQRKAEQQGDARRYAFEYKKFRHWQEKMAPFVKPDGRIMNPAERLELWKQQYQNRN